MEPSSIVHLKRENADGRVIDIDGPTVWVETTDGFEYLVDASDLIETDADAIRQLLKMSQTTPGSVKKADADTPTGIPAPSARKPRTVDLHAEKLIPDRRGLTAAEIHQKQIDTIRQELDRLSGKPGSSVIFIHGKGDGTLRNDLLSELTRRSPHFTRQDADPIKFGFQGATLVRYT